MPILREKRIVITFDEYKKTEEDEELGDKFIIFKPLVIMFTGEDHLRFRGAKDFSKKMSRAFDLDIAYSKLFGKKGIFILNENTVPKSKLEELFDNEGKFSLDGKDYKAV